MQEIRAEDPRVTRVFRSVTELFSLERNGDAQSAFLIDQVEMIFKSTGFSRIITKFLNCQQLLNFHKKPKGIKYSQWTIKYAIILSGSSTSTYIFIREEGLLALPSHNTLRMYIGSTHGDVGVTDLVMKRLKMECDALSPIERIGSLPVDGMQVKFWSCIPNNKTKARGRSQLGGVRSRNRKNHS